MVVLKWIGMFLLYWLIGSVVASIINLGFAFIGIDIGTTGTGLIILIVILLGLFMYGRKRRK